MQFENSKSFAEALDQEDPLASYRNEFHFPQHAGNPVTYFCGNSLGLQPKKTREYILKELDHWEKEGVEGHFRGDHPWMYYHKFLSAQNARLVGAKESEVVVMNTLTTNLHLLMVSFYRPSKSRYKIIMEGGAFPSDQYGMESQVKFHGFEPEDAIIEAHPREGEHYLRTEDIIALIKKHGDEVALVMFGGVNYYTGQFFDLESITKVGHEVGAQVGFDLAHAAGNVVLELHEWNVDFAVWCSYKYLNAGPGGPSGAFVHERHGNNPELPRFAGWWGHNEEERFKMEKGFIPMQGAEGWQLSNAQIFSFAAYRASLELHDKVGMKALRKKADQLTAYLEFVVEAANRPGLDLNIITPKDKKNRGSQLSILTGANGKALFDHLASRGFICDWREPNVIRLAPVPLYNSYQDVWKFGEALNSFMDLA